MALEAVQAQAGHRSLESTRIYLHLTNDWLAERVPAGRGAHRRRQCRGRRDARCARIGRPVNALPAVHGRAAAQPSRIEWAEIAAAAPQLAETMRRYLRQAATFLAPASVASADGALRIFARWLLANTSVVAVADVSRDAIEDFKVYLAARPGIRGGSLTENTQRQRLRTLRVFFERIIEWDWADAPLRNPILNWDLPRRPEPLPRFLDDRDAAKLMAAAPPCSPRRTTSTSSSMTPPSQTRRASSTWAGTTSPHADSDLRARHHQRDRAARNIPCRDREQPRRRVASPHQAACSAPRRTHQPVSSHRPIKRRGRGREEA